MLFVLATLFAALLAGCGGTATGAGTGSTARTLLKQTFGGSHKVDSGRLSFQLTLKPSGSKSFTAPITLAFGGPFQSLGSGKLPKSDFTVSISAEGHTGALSIISTGSKGYVSVSGTAYQLPASEFKQLESSFSTVASPASGGGGKGTLGKVGVDPMSWLVNPQVAGTGTVGGTSATEIKAGVQMPNLLRDLNKLLAKAPALGVSGSGSVPTSITSAQQAEIAREVKNPTIRVWTGSSDKTVRRLALSLSLPVSGQTSSLLGGMTSAALSLQLNYSDLNQPQAITAPTKVQPYSQFQKKLSNVVTEIEGVIAEYAQGASGSATSTGAATAPAATSTTGGSGATVSSYSQCITAAGSDVAKMQKCASLLGSGG